MLKGLTAALGLGAVALFSYFYLTTSAEKSRTERAKEAGMQIVEASKQQGVAVLVQSRLAAKVGIDTMRFVHVHMEGNKALIYGLLPANVAPETLAEAARECPGVTEVELMTHARPDYVTALKPIQFSQPKEKPAELPAP